VVTDEAARSRGHGGALLAWLVDQARSADCRSLELDSGVQRFDAHRFYLTNRMAISAHHFRLVL
jgi:GNAT superfamily N-acetyltransferase